jgi:hypothetical protein
MSMPRLLLSATAVGRKAVIKPPNSHARARTKAGVTRGFTSDVLLATSATVYGGRRPRVARTPSFPRFAGAQSV